MLAIAGAAAKMQANASVAMKNFIDRLLLISITALGIVFLSELPSYLGLFLWEQQYVVVILGLGLAKVFLDATGKGHARFQNLLNGGATAVAILIGFYTAWRWPSLALGHFDMPYDLLAALLLLALILEATRRICGVTLFLLTIAAVALAITADHLPAPLTGRAVPWDRFAIYLYTDASGIVGMPLNIATTVVLAFTLFGVVLFKFGGGQIFIDLALLLVGRMRGGSAKAAIVSSSLFGSITGSAVSNAVTTGAVTIPLMKKTGFSPHKAAAVEAVASTGGQLMPPVMGAAAFLMADFIGVPYAEVALAALVPAILFYAAVFIQVHLESVRQGASALSDDQIPQTKQTLASSWMVVIPLAALVYVLFYLNWSATKAGLIGSAVALALSVLYVRGRVTLSDLLSLLTETSQRMIDIILVTAVAGIVIAATAATGIGFSFALQISELSGGNVAVLLVLVAIAALILGMGMPTAGVYVLLAVIAAPALVQQGIELMAAHLFVLYFGILSMVTPPVCLAVFATASIAKADFIKSAATSVKLATTIYLIPFLFVFSPTLLLRDGSALEIVLNIASAFVGIAALGVVIVGNVTQRSLSIVERVVLLFSAVLMLWPKSVSFPLDGFISAAALGCVGVAVSGLLIYLQERRSMATSN